MNSAARSNSATRSDARHDKFESLLPFTKALLRPDEAAQCLGFDRDHIYGLIVEGKLEAHADADRDRPTYRITRRSVLARLAKTAQYGPDDFLEVIETQIKTLSGSQIDRLIVRAQRIRQEKS